MAAIQADGTNRFKLVLTIAAYGQAVSEAYANLVASNWERAIAVGRLIAAWRGAVLGRGGIIESGVVSEMGRARKSKVAFNRPINGTTGVHFGYEGSVSKHAKLHTLGTSVRLRFDTQEGDHAVRGLLGPCDRWVNNYQWVDPPFSAGVFDIGDIATPANTPDAPIMPKDALWNFSAAAAHTAPSTSEGWVSYQEAWRMLIRVIAQNTTYSLKVVNDAGAVTGLDTRAWYKVGFRGFGGKAVGKSSGQ